MRQANILPEWCPARSARWPPLFPWLGGGGPVPVRSGGGGGLGLQCAVAPLFPLWGEGPPSLYGRAEVLVGVSWRAGPCPVLPSAGGWSGGMSLLYFCSPIALGVVDGTRSLPPTSTRARLERAGVWAGLVGGSALLLPTARDKRVRRSLWGPSRSRPAVLAGVAAGGVRPVVGSPSADHA